MLIRRCYMIADLRKDRTIDVLHGQPAVTNHFSCDFQADRPQAKTKYTVTLHVFIDPIPSIFFLSTTLGALFSAFAVFVPIIFLYIPSAPLFRPS